MILSAIKTSALAAINRHNVNIKIMLENPQSIPEHIDIVQAVEDELLKVAHQVDILESMKQYDDWDMYE